MRIPKNKIISNKTTQGGEYMVKSTQQEYKGDYYVVGSNYYTGKVFSTSSKELVKIENDKINSLLAQASTFSYGQINTNKSLNNLLNVGKIPSSAFKVTSDDVQRGYITRYFCKQKNHNPILIKEISEVNYRNLQNNPTYQVLSLQYNLLVHDTSMGEFDPDQLHNADLVMPGLMAFLKS